MDFKDWRNSARNPGEKEQAQRPGRLRGRQYHDYIEEQIQEAEARG